MALNAILSHCCLLLFLCGSIAFQSSTAQIPIARIETGGPQGEAISVSETVGQFEVCVVLDRPVNDTANILIRSQDLTNQATEGEDFVGFETTLTFVPAILRQCINISIVDDDVYEGPVEETFSIGLNLVAGEPDIDADRDFVTYSITESDFIFVGFSQEIYTASEKDTEDLMVCLRLINGSISEGISVTVDLVEDILETTATSADFTINNDEVVFTSMTVDPVCITIGIEDDSIIEGTEMFGIYIADNSEIRFISNTTDITISDDDVATLSLNMLNFEVVEGNLTDRNAITICTVLSSVSGGLRRSVIINVESMDNSATGGIDYQQVMEMITIPTETVGGTAFCINVTIIGDDQRESNESFTVRFTSTMPDVFVGGVGTASASVVILEDNDVNSCRTLFAPTNGGLDQGGSNLNDVTTYTCNEGFMLVPAASATRTCEQNDWSGSNPTCVVRCVDLMIDDGIVILADPVEEGSNAVYSCNVGFDLEGESRRTCQGNGDWSGDDPSCIVRRCERLNNPEFGGVSLRGGPGVGEMATYSCLRNFILTGGTVTRECREDGTWSGVEPICSGAITLTSSLMAAVAVLLALSSYFLL